MGAPPRMLASIDGLGRADWLELRRRGIGGSDAPVVLGWSPWTSPWALYLDKIGELHDDEPHEAMRWGQRLEAVIADAYAEDTGHEILDPQAMYQHAELDWMLANPDRLIGSDDHDDLGYLEIKNVTTWKAEEWADDEVPLHYLIQWQHTAEVLNVDWGAFAALLGGNRLLIRPMERDAELIGMLKAAEEEFWGRVQRREPPPIDGMDSTEELLKQLFSESDPTSEVVVDDDVARAVADYHAANATLKDVDYAKTLAGNRIREALGTAEQGVLIDGTPIVTWKQGTSTRLDQKAHQAEQPECHAKYSPTTVTRTLRPSKSRKGLEALERLLPDHPYFTDDERGSTDG